MTGKVLCLFLTREKFTQADFYLFPRVMLRRILWWMFIGIRICLPCFGIIRILRASAALASINPSVVDHGLGLTRCKEILWLPTHFVFTSRKDTGSAKKRRSFGETHRDHRRGK